MAKVQNMWLKGAVGKVGNSTVYSSSGKTIIRNGKSNVKNPQTYAQMIQRVFAKTANAQYVALQEIANHSFQGRATGEQCMSRFLSRNMNYMRQRAANIQNAGGSIYSFFQFMPKNSIKFTPTAAIISEGSLPKVTVTIQNGGGWAEFNYNGGDTYGDIIKGLGLKRGDQLTFVTVGYNFVTTDYDVKYMRVILDPRNANGTAAPLNTSFNGSQGQINCANARNFGSYVTCQTASPGKLEFRLDGNTIVAAGVIVSRRSKKRWLRSSCQLVLNEAALGNDLMSLGDAVDTSLATNTIITDADEYLNNAGIGGVSVESMPSPSSTGVQISDTVSIDGIEQDVSGGSVEYHMPGISRVRVFGNDIPNNYLTFKVGSESAEAQQLDIREDGTYADANLNVPQSTTSSWFYFYKGETLWFRLWFRRTEGYE